MENIFFVKYPRMYLVEDTFIGYVYKVSRQNGFIPLTYQKL